MVTQTQTTDLDEFKNSMIAYITGSRMNENTETYDLEYQECWFLRALAANGEGHQSTFKTHHDWFDGFHENFSKQLLIFVDSIANDGDKAPLEFSSTPDPMNISRMSEVWDVCGLIID